MKRHAQNISNASAILLRKSGLRATPARLAVLALMEKSKHPLSTQGLIEKMAKDVDQATVYRIVHDLVGRGIIRQVDLRHNHAHYERADAKDHHHLICMQCGRMQDITGCGVEHMYKGILQAANWCAQVRQHALEFYGVCKTCPAGAQAK
ncbi:MAG: hypothetical protein A3J10_01840 [Candidatus Sungbacteria bacterium RIFCSPLOWO2_02_FULL_54_10]|uniref:Transcriptional repressor n=1 Tax=Candidatus Sungbacteria bacterium RIFCSPLOWO2_01_FULL_54_21 TaxID=1802279 RepID=A0A1G2L8M3_9BACT|nr:MAG: hypothetical protein A3B34_00170 [Candidatus Sungbacteria bacterium RIFCSPLOWO2_01_FULL_54_21]OHA12517.1 MAG: hypothetical protein A3J10_01840 [Candidatus Sungbacteria bacterium RIFCSPLOWO2_02_FULL_54_10]